MGMESYKLGIKGEEAAEKYLVQHGFEILEKNFHSQQGEVDIIARDREVLVFIEVKSYSFRSLGSPLSSIRKSKRESVIHAARTYLLKKGLNKIACRFDVLTMYRKANGSREIEHLKNAFFADRK